MRIEVEHTTRYRYQREAAYSLQCLRLTPVTFDGQNVASWSIDVRSAGHMLASADGFGNVVHLASITTPHSEIEITARGIVDVTDRRGVVSGVPERVPLRVYLKHTSLTEASERIAAITSDAGGSDRVAWLHTLMSRIRDRVDYTPGATDASTTANAALEAAEGVCQDHAHIFIAAARIAGVPARYVTGYLLLGTSADAAAHHAWAEAWIEGLGWVGFDVANRICPTDRYVRLAVGLDARYAAPVRGTRRGGSEGEALEVAVRVAEAQGQQ